MSQRLLQITRENQSMEMLEGMPLAHTHQMLTASLQLWHFIIFIMYVLYLLLGIYRWGARLLIAVGILVIFFIFVLFFVLFS